MAVVVRCPKCDEKFKTKDGQEGKKIRCPHCERAFVLEERITAKAGKASKPAPAPAPPPIPLVETPKPPPPEPAKSPFDDEDTGPNKYDVTHTELQALCPNCARPLKSDRDIICTFCGYNTQTREMGKTEKLIEHTAGEHFMYLLPGLICVGFILMQTIGILFYCLVLPYTIASDSWMTYTDHESMRMWTVIISLFDIWPAGIFAFNRLVLNPTPPKKVKD